MVSLPLASPSRHVQELAGLCASHPLVRVRFTGPYDDTLTLALALALALVLVLALALALTLAP